MPQLHAPQTHADAQAFITAYDTFALIHHGDADSVSSAAIILRTLAHLGKTVAVTIALPAVEHRITQATIDNVKRSGAHAVITVDFCANSDMHMLRSLAAVAPVLVIDHHRPSGPGEKHIIIYKPDIYKDIEPAKFPTAALAYFLCADLVSAAEQDALAWRACIGILGDSAYAEFKEFVDTTLASIGVDTCDVRKTPFGRILKLINFANATGSEAVAEACAAVTNASTYPIILDLLGKHARVGQEIKQLYEAFLERATTHTTPAGDTIIYEIDSPYDVGSNLSTALSFALTPGKNLIIIQKLASCYRIHARRQDFKEDMAALLQRAIAGIPNAYAGGHKPAAGASIPHDALERFKRQLIGSGSDAGTAAQDAAKAERPAKKRRG